MAWYPNNASSSQPFNVYSVQLPYFDPTQAPPNVVQTPQYQLPVQVAPAQYQPHIQPPLPVGPPPQIAAAVPAAQYQPVMTQVQPPLPVGPPPQIAAAVPAAQYQPVMTQVQPPLPVGPPPQQIAAAIPQVSYQQVVPQVPPPAIPVQSQQVVPQTTQPQMPQYQQAPTEQQPEKPRASTFPHLEGDNLTYVVVNSTAASYIQIFTKLQQTIEEDDWHRFIIGTPINDKAAIIQALNVALYPAKITPLYFQKQGPVLSFLANNCSAAILSLIKMNLKIRCSLPEFPEIYLVIRIKARKLDMAPLFTKIALSRLDEDKRNLDYSNLAEIPEVQEMVEKPGTCSYVMRNLLQHALVLAPSLVSICLANNGMETTEDLGVAYTNKYKDSLGKRLVLRDKSHASQPLRVLDLSYNAIRVTTNLEHIKTIPITELYLHNNPLCKVYDDKTYVSVIKAKFPNLLKLDGAYLPHSPGLPCWKPNFFVLNVNSDTCVLAEQFVEHFFMLYDQKQRSCLRGIYHDDAYFSLTTSYLPGQSTSLNAKLKPYLALNRNLLRMSDMTQRSKLLSCGADDILKLQEKLPRTQHDFYSFTIDVTHHTATSTILTVTGIFRKPTSSKEMDSCSPRHFMRTFVLTTLPNDEYQITNDIMLISNATTAQEEAAFRYTLPEPSKDIDSSKSQLTDHDKLHMTDFLSQLTEMKSAYARKCLEDAAWDFKEALAVFTELYKQDKIPKAAFEIKAAKQF